MSADRIFAAFLLRASEEFLDGGWVFTGFNLPVLAARVARRRGGEFVQALEAGAALDRDTERLLTSTTDHYETAPVTCWRGTTADVMTAIVPKCRRVLIDAANVDIAGRTNTTVIGEWSHPTVRLPGGGGGPEASFRARHLVLLHGGTRLDRLVAEMAPVTCAPAPDATVRLLTRWGSLTLGDDPRLDTLVDGPEADAFIAHASSLGVDTDGWVAAAQYSPGEYALADGVMTEALSCGYALHRGHVRKGEQA